MPKQKKIQRKKQKNTWTLTDEAKAQIPEWNQRWIELALSCEPIDMERLVPAIHGMYEAAGLKKPRVVYCQSPIQAAIVWSFASAIWEERGEGQTDEEQAALSTACATRLDADTATYEGGDGGDLIEVCTATEEATEQAVVSTSSDGIATRGRTFDDTMSYADTIPGMWDAAAKAAREITGKDLTRRAKEHLKDAWRAPNGGNEWAPWCAYISFVRDIIGWSCPEHENYKHYEDAAKFGGWRFMHKEFCLVADRPAKRHTYVQNGRHILHCDDGPAILWRCGTPAWYLDGLQVDEQIVMAPETQTVEQINQEENGDIRIVRMERFGRERYLQEVGAEVVDTLHNEIQNTQEAVLKTPQGEMFFIATCPSGRNCPPLHLPPHVQTCEEAQQYFVPEHLGRAQCLART